MPEVWTHDNLSRHFMPRSNTVFQLFILLCSIVSFMFLFNWQHKITDFLEDQQISLEKSRYEVSYGAHSVKAKTYSVWSFDSLPRKLITALERWHWYTIIKIIFLYDNTYQSNILEELFGNRYMRPLVALLFMFFLRYKKGKDCLSRRHCPKFCVNGNRI